LKTAKGSVVSITTRGNDAVRIGVRDSDGRQTAWEVFTVAEVETLERKLKAARDKIRRKLGKKKSTR